MTTTAKYLEQKLRPPSGPLEWNHPLNLDIALIPVPELDTVGDLVTWLDDEVRLWLYTAMELFGGDEPRSAPPRTQLATRILIEAVYAISAISESLRTGERPEHEPHEGELRLWLPIAFKAAREMLTKANASVSEEGARLLGIIERAGVIPDEEEEDAA